MRELFDNPLLLILLFMVPGIAGIALAALYMVVRRARRSGDRDPPPPDRL